MTDRPGDSRNRGNRSKQVRIVAYGDDPSQFVEVWSPDANRPKGTAILIHGGYWRDCYGLDLMDPMADHLTDRGWAVVNIEYRRLAEPVGAVDGQVPVDPEIWTKMSSDVEAAVGCAVEPMPSPNAPNALHQSGAGRRPAVAIGHSAGGHLALWAATRGAIDGVVALAPVADLVAADRLDLSTGVVRRLLGGDSETKPERYRAASPIALTPLGVPQLVVHGPADENVPQQISTDYVNRASAGGDDVVLEAPSDVDHFDVIDPGHPVWRSIDRWLDARHDG